MKILHLTDNYPPTMGGLELFVQSLATMQARAGHSVTVVSTELTGAPNRTVESGVTVIRLPFALRRVPGAYVDDRRVFFPPLPDPFFERALNKVLADAPPDVAHVHGWILYSALGPVRRAGAAVVVTAHDYGNVCAIKTLFPEGRSCSGPGWAKCVSCAHRSYGLKGIPIALGLHAASYRHAKVDAWTAPSAAVAWAGSAVRAKDRRAMALVPCFAPEPILHGDAPPRPSFVPADGPYLMFAGALGIYKGVDTLLSAHHLLWESGLRVPLAIAGQAIPGQDFHFDLPGVTVVSQVPHDEVMAGWIHATAGIVPSAWAEPFGQVALECMAAGTPVVVTNVGGLAEIVDHGRCGVVVEAGSASGLADAIRGLLDDPDAASRLGEAGRERAADYTSASVCGMVDRVYDKALAVRDSDRTA